MRAKSLIAVTVFVAIGATACGSSSKSTSPGATTATTAPGSTTSGGSSPGAAPTTVKLSSSGSGNFCAEARKGSGAFSSPNPAAITPDALKKAYENLGPELQKAADEAPSAIKGDFQVFINAFSPYLKALADANYDFTKLNVSALGNLDSPAVKAATQHIEQYFTQVCHITTPAT